MEFLSTSSLANEIAIPANELFNKLKELGWIERKSEKWVLTDIGRKKGGQTRTSQKFGEYIVWPENLSIENDKNNKPHFLSATAIGKNFNVSSQRVNLILSELGYIKKGISGWDITNLGKTLGGKQFEHDTSGGTYVLWPGSIVQNKSLNEVFNESQVSKVQESANSIQEEVIKTTVPGDFRLKFEAKHRTLDGHYVRSRAEVIIDNLLYQYGVVHAYERKLPVDEEVLCDFYLPAGKVYIEYWGLEDNARYAERKKKKLEIFNKYEIPLIELNDEDILNLDDNLPKKLLKYGIKVY